MHASCPPCYLPYCGCSSNGVDRNHLRRGTLICADYISGTLPHGSIFGTPQPFDGCIDIEPTSAFKARVVRLARKKPLT